MRRQICESISQAQNMDCGITSLLIGDVDITDCDI